MAVLKKTRLNVNLLEGRDVPAGSVMNSSLGNFSGSSGSVNLAVTFTGNNFISWNTAPATMPSTSASGTTKVANLNINLTGCSKNSAGLVTGNSVLVDLGGFTLNGNVNIITGQCDDRVTLFNGTVSGKVTISTSGGNDSVVLGNSKSTLFVGQNTTIQESTGNDFVALVGSLGFGANLGISMGPGNNQYGLATNFTVANNMAILAGTGNDPVGVVGSAASTIKGSFFANPGAGANDLTLPCGLAISGNAVYVGGAGSDNLAVDANIGGNLLALLGAGNDTFTYGSVPGCCPMIAGTAFIDGGLGIDTYNASTTCKVTWPNTILNFP